MRVSGTRKKVEDLLEEEFDDDFLQKDGKLFLTNYYGACPPPHSSMPRPAARQPHRQRAAITTPTTAHVRVLV